MPVGNNSFTSSSDQVMKLKIINSVFLSCLFAGSFATTAWLLPQLHLRPGKTPRVQKMPAFDEQGSDAFFVSAGSQSLSHIALYHNIGHSIENARKADILFFGNSRTQSGFDEEVITQEADALGLKVFSIATGHSDNAQLALELIRKHDLRPKVVVASGGHFLFTGKLSPWAKEVLSMDRWQARKFFYERQASWAFKLRLHRLVPRVSYFNHRLVSRSIHYRSVENGWWRFATEPPGRYPVGRIEERKNYRNTLPGARKFKSELDQRDALLVLTMVPYNKTRSGHLPYLSSELKVPAILPSFEEMYTSDGSHLNRDSAFRLTEDFWGKFVSLESVREKLEIE
jgi:hypothetical protein